MFQWNCSTDKDCRPLARLLKVFCIWICLNQVVADQAAKILSSFTFKFRLKFIVLILLINGYEFQETTKIPLRPSAPAPRVRPQKDSSSWRGPDPAGPAPKPQLTDLRNQTGPRVHIILKIKLIPTETGPTTGSRRGRSFTTSASA